MLEKRKTMKNVIVAGAAVAVMLVGAASAYFTSTDAETNTWTVGSVDVVLNEEAYDASDTDNITPMQELAKDPSVENTGDNAAFVFVKFSIPKANVKTAGDDGTVNAAAMQELFNYQIDGEWTQVGETVSGTDTNTYVYAYAKNGECTELDPKAETTSVFKDGKITFINIIEDEVTGQLEIPVETYAIQTTNLTSDDKTDPASVWAILSKQTPTATAKTTK